MYRMMIWSFRNATDAVKKYFLTIPGTRMTNGVLFVETAG